MNKQAIREVLLDALSHEALERVPAEQKASVLDSLERGIATIVSAHEYASVHFESSHGFIPVHNAHVASWLKERYSAHDISELIDRLDQWDTFSAEADPVTGLVRTSDARENREMSERQWVTDSVLCGYWQKKRDRAGWIRNLCVLSAFTLSPGSREAAAHAISDPAWYHEKKEDGSYFLMRGMPHIFLRKSVKINPALGLPVPESIEVDRNWFNQKRLESQALLLRALCSDFESSDPETVKMGASAASLLAEFLAAVNRDLSSPAGDPHFNYQAPTASSWEEIPFPGGMTSDIVQCVLAFEALRDLLKRETPLAQAVREALVHGSYARVFRSEDVLSRLISEGRDEVSRRITERLKAGVPPFQNEERPYDMSLAFPAASGYRLVEEPVENARLYLQLFDFLEKHLLREHGMIRYSPHEFSAHGGVHQIQDSYLGIGYWLPPSLRSVLLKGAAGSEKTSGSRDASTLEEMEARQQGTPRDTEAQWCLGVSAILQGLCLLAVDIIQSPSSASRKERKVLLRNINERIDYYITRNLALLSPENPDGDILKSNGYPVPAFKVMEAYEAIPSLDGVSALWVPGAHPLNWGMAQLFDGLHRAMGVKEKLKI